MADKPTQQDDAPRSADLATDGTPSFRQLTSPADAAPELRQALIECWVDVTNAGGAAGFPYPPIDETDAVTALDRILDQGSIDASLGVHVGDRLSLFVRPRSGRDCRICRLR